MRKCEICLDVAIYCKCAANEDLWNPSHGMWVTDNPTFWIYRGDEKVEWDKEGRALWGDPKLIEDLMEHLDGEYVTVLYPMQLPMVPQDPYAVHWVAKHKLKGCTFSKSAPKWGRFSKPGVVY